MNLEIYNCKTGNKVSSIHSQFGEVLGRAINYALSDDELEIIVENTKPDATILVNGIRYGYFTISDIWATEHHDQWHVIDRQDVPVHVLELAQILAH